MNRPNPPPGFSGIVAIIAALIMASMVISALTKTYANWLALALALLVSVWAVEAINRR